MIPEEETKYLISDYLTLLGLLAFAGRVIPGMHHKLGNLISSVPAKIRCDHKSHNRPFLIPER